MSRPEAIYIVPPVQDKGIKRGLIELVNSLPDSDFPENARVVTMFWILKPSVEIIGNREIRGIHYDFKPGTPTSER